MIDQILDKKDQYPKELVELAEDLQAMRKNYATLAANFSHRLFTNQDALAINGKEAQAVQTNIIAIRENVNKATDKITEILIKNVPGPAVTGQLNLPFEDS